MTSSQSPVFAVASFFAASGHISAKFDFDGKKEKIGLLNQYNLTCHLGCHQLVSKDCRGQVFCYFWPDLSHFKSDFYGKKEKSGLLNLYNITSNVASHQLVSHDCSSQLFCYFWPYLSHFKSDFDGLKEKIGLLNQYNIQANPTQFCVILS